MAKSTTIRTLAVSFTAKTDKFSKGIKKMQRQLGNFARDVGNTVKKIAKIGMAVAAAGAAAGAGIFYMANRVTQAGDRIAKASKSTGVAVEDLSALGFAAERSGSDLESVIKSMGIFAKAAAYAGDGLVTYTREFDKLGVSVLDNKGNLKDTKTLFLETADAIGRLQNNTQRMASARTLFGRAGGDLIPMFLEGERGIARLMAKAKQLGAVWTSEQAKMSEVFQDTLLDMKTAFGGLTREITMVVAPKITEAMQFVTSFIVKNRDKIVEAWKWGMDKIGKAIIWVRDLLAGWAKSGMMDEIVNRFMVGARFIGYDFPRLMIRGLDVIGTQVDLLVRKIIWAFKRMGVQLAMDAKIMAGNMPLFMRNMLGVPSRNDLADSIIKDIETLESMRAPTSPAADTAVAGLKTAFNDMLDNVDKQMSQQWIKKGLFPMIKDALTGVKDLFGEKSGGIVGIARGAGNLLKYAWDQGKGKVLDLIDKAKDFGQAIKEDIAKQAKAAGVPLERPAALERGTSAAYSASLGKPGGGIEKPMKQIAQETKKSSAYEKKQVELLIEILDGANQVAEF